MKLMRRAVGLYRGLMRFFDWSDDENLGLISAGVAFYGFFAIFPAVAAVIAIWGLVSDPQVIESYLPFLAEIMPPEAFSTLAIQVRTLVHAQTGTLGWTGVISLLIALWSSRSGVAAFIRGLNRIHNVGHRQTLHREFTSIGLTLVLVAMVLVALATMVMVPIGLALLPLGTAGARVLASLPWMVMFAMIQITISLVYRYGPNIRPKMPWFTPGGFFTAALWIAASIAFSAYLANFASYNRIYGSLGAVVALLTWFYIAAYVALLGAAIDQNLRQRGKL